MSADSLAEQIAAAARDLEGEFDRGATMDKAVKLSVQLVPGAEEAGISLLHRHGGTIDTPAATSDLVRRIDALQYHFDEGPCLDAIRFSEVVQSPDVGTDERWPRWGPAAADETGVRSMMCFRLFTYGDRLGALNLYSRRADAFDAEDREHGLAIAAQTATAVAAVQEIDQLKAGMDTRGLIGEAQGIIMERYGVEDTVAFAVLARLSSHTNQKLREVAWDIVKTRRLPDEPNT
jgi:GAF domain-containing protein